MPYQKVDYAIIAGLLRLGDEGNRRLSVYQSARISGTPFNIPRGSLVGQSDRRPCTSIYSTVVDTTHSYFRRAIIKLKMTFEREPLPYRQANPEPTPIAPWHNW
jgi:hypothetical protein